MSGVRTFVGIPLSEDVRSTLLDACACVRDADHTWRGEKWVPETNLHVTLGFIGDVRPDRIDELAQAISIEVGDGHRAFSLPVDGLRVVPSRRRARMLWAAFLDPEGTCAALASAVRRASLPFGAEPDERAYSPHVTLVRARKPHSLSETALEAGAGALSNGPASMSVTRFTLYSSTLNSGAPVYAQLRSYTLES